MKWLMLNAMDCLKYGYSYTDFLAFNHRGEKCADGSYISDEEYRKAWDDAMHETTKDI